MATKKRVTDRNTGKATTKPRRVFQKDMTLRITGGSKEVVQRVAAAIHRIDHEDIVGGAKGRKAQVATVSSTEPTQVFYGNL